MATIPISQRRVKDGGQLGAPRRPFQLPENALGSGNYRQLDKLGGALKNVGHAVYQRYEKLQNKKDQLDSFRAYYALNDELRVLEKGEDGKGGYYSQSGFNAEGVTKKLDQNFVDLSDKYKATLKNDRQIRMFDMSVARLRDSSLDRMGSYEQKQYGVMEREALGAKNTMEIESALDAYDKPEMFHAELGRANNTLRARLDMEGVPDETVELKVKSQTSKTLAAAIVRMSKNSPEAAATWYKAEKKNGSMLTNQQVEVEAALERDDTLVQSQSNTDRILLKYPEDETKALEQARAIKNPKVRDSVVQRVKYRFAEEKRIEKQTNFQITDDLTSGINSSKTYQQALNLVERGPTGGAKKELEHYARWRFSGSRGRYAAQSNYKKFFEALERIDKTVRNEASPEEKIANAEQLERQYAPYLKASDYNKVQEYFRGEGQISQLKNSKIQQVFERYSGKDPNDEQALYNQFWSYTIDQLEFGMKPTDKDLNESATEFFMQAGEARRKGTFFFGYGEDMPYSEAVEKGTEDTWLPEMTDDERVRLEERIKVKNKKLPQSEQIIADDVYLRKLKRRALYGY